MPLFGTRVRDELTRVQANLVEPADPVAAGGMGLTYGGFLLPNDAAVTRELADTVPAYRRARTLVASSVGLLKLRQRDSRGNLLPSIPFLRSPDPGRVTSAVLADTVSDLADYGVAYWLNPRWDSADGWRYADSTRTVRKHVSVKYLPVTDVEDVTDSGYRILVDGVPKYVPSFAVVGFECSAGRWLSTGARAISTLRLLEDAARMYAETPQPVTVLTNNGPRKTPSQVDELVAAWETARRTRSTAYLGRDIAAESIGFDATQIALADARSYGVLDIARVTGVPSLYLSQGPADASMTYINATQARLDLQAAMQPFTTAIAERLSFDDVTGQGVTVEFDFSAWLTVDPAYRADLWQKLTAAGVLSTDEARALEPLVAEIGNPR